jgi:hypothetical protein
LPGNQCSPQTAPSQDLSIPKPAHLIRSTLSYFLASLDSFCHSSLSFLGVSLTPAQGMSHVSSFSIPLPASCALSLVTLCPSHTHDQTSSIVCPTPTEGARDNPTPSASWHLAKVCCNARSDRKTMPANAPLEAEVGVPPGIQVHFELEPLKP